MVAVAPAAGEVNLTVVGAVVPKTGTPVGKLKPVLTAVKAALATGAVEGVMATAGRSFKEIIAGSLPPPQAANAATATREKTNLAEFVLLLKKLFIVDIPVKNLVKNQIKVTTGNSFKDRTLWRS